MFLIKFFSNSFKIPFHYNSPKNMGKDEFNMRKCIYSISKKIWLLLIFLELFSSGVFFLDANAQESVSMDLNRNLGVDIGKNINGKFTLKCQGTEGIVRLKIYFNNEIVAEENSNSLKFTFKTENYPSGNTNITLKGWDANGTEFQTSKQYNFLKQWIEWAIIAGVAVVLIVYYFGKYQKRKKNNQKEVKIEINP